MIGDSDIIATGHSYLLSRQTARVHRKQRTVWERVKEVLQERKLPATQKYLAEKILQVKQPSISDWNKIGGYPTMANAIRVADYLGISVEWLLTEQGPKWVPAKDPESDALQRLWMDLDGLGRSRVLAHAQILATPVPETTESPTKTSRPVRQRTS